VPPRRADGAGYNRPVRRALLPLLLLAALAAAAPSAAAGDGRVVLRMRDGRLLPGRVVAVDARGVRHETPEGTNFWPWEALTDYGQYEARAAALGEEDAEGRLALGRWCLESGLPGEARREIQRARGLGAAGPGGAEEDFDGLLEKCDRLQAEAAFVEADRLAAAGDLDGALEVLRSYLVQAPPSAWTTRGRDRAADVVRRREADEARRRLEAEARRRDDARVKREAAIAGHLAEGDDARTRAGVLVLAALREENGGSFTRFRDGLEGAEALFLEARRSYERSRRLAADGMPAEARTAASGRSAVDGRLLDLHLRLARKLVEYKDWKDAQAALDKALALDPVHPEGLDLQEKVRNNWIRRKASGVTGAGGTTEGGR
jgi:tetratricopeptide (TPR) repeat protein